MRKLAHFLCSLLLRWSLLNLILVLTSPYKVLIWLCSKSLGPMQSLYYLRVRTAVLWLLNDACHACLAKVDWCLGSQVVGACCSVTLNTEDGDLLLDYSKNLIDNNVMQKLFQLVSFLAFWPLTVIVGQVSMNRFCHLILVIEATHSLKNSQCDHRTKLMKRGTVLFCAQL